MKRSPIIPLALFLLGLTATSGPSISQDGSKIRVRNKVPSQASPFALEEVRLLDGPFRDAMLRDQKYLLEIDSAGPARPP